MEKMLLIGMGGHARSVVDSIQAAGRYEIAGFVDNQKDPGESYRGLPLLGTDDDLPRLYREGITCAFVCVGFLGFSQVRQTICENLRHIGFALPSVIDPTAVLASDASIGDGVFVGKRAVLNSGAQVGDLAIINTGAIVEHDCTVGAYSHVSVSATLCGGVTVGENALIGAGATVIQGASVGAGAVIGAGSMVVFDIAENKKAYGVPCREVDG